MLSKPFSVLTSIIFFFALAVLSACNFNRVPEGTKLDIRLLETTDLHANMMNYNYFSANPDNKVGLVKTASLIRSARGEVENSLLVDNGDLIQGAALGDYMSKVKGQQVINEHAVHPIFKAMNTLDYDVGNIGNHEFNFGLPFLDNSIDDANFPYISANVFIDDGDNIASNDKPYFLPYVIQEKRFKDTKGKTRKLKVGFIGFVPPQIMIWDKNNLEGKVIAKDIVEMAKKYVPEMKQKGADLVIAIPHSGISIDAARGKDEQSSYYLSKVKGIDAILFGHSHANFPSEKYQTDALKAAGVDAIKGSLNGVPAVMPGFWGDNLGVIDLQLTYRNKQWEVSDFHTQLRPIYKRQGRDIISLIESDEAVEQAVREEHIAAIEWVNQPIAKISKPINSFFALVRDDASIQVVNEAQIWYTRKLIQGDINLQDLPVLGSVAPFRTGFGGQENYTNVPAGNIAFRNIADLYLYPNTLKVLKMTGLEVKEWLEKSAAQFNTIDPASTDVQPLINSSFPSYNFDMFDGISYEIDVTVPPRYVGRNSVLANPDSHRIVNLRYQGKELDLAANFLVVTNNYRAGGGGKFPNVTADKIVIDAPDENRKVVAGFLTEKTQENPEEGYEPNTDQNWKFKPINASVNVVYYGSSLPEAIQMSETIKGIVNTGVTTDRGYTIYRIDMSL